MGTLFLTRSDFLPYELIKLECSEHFEIAILISFFKCGHCKSMAPAWEKLADEWAGHAIGMIAEVDCTEPSGQSLCEEYGVEGFPTLMYGDPNGPEVCFLSIFFAFSTYVVF
jgi:thiol-disulfide isomerase/thioredoxin